VDSVAEAKSKILVVEDDLDVAICSLKNEIAAPL
jgi:hypothetical protein